MSAIADELNGTPELITVLFTLYNDMDLLDVAGPYDIFANALHAKNQHETKAFRVICAGPETAVTSSGIGFAANVSFEQALKNLSSVDVVVVPGSRKDLTLKNNPDVVGLIKAYAALQKKDPSRERTILGVGVAALAFVEADILADMVATTHPDFITKLEIICSNKKTRDMTSRTDVMEERYIVNNPRFELGNNEEENPYILTRKELKEQKRRKSSSGGLPSPVEEHSNGTGRRPSSARKGSVSFKASNNDRDGVMKRKVLPQSGLRVLTTNGSAAGADAALYLVGALVSDDSAEESARQSGWTWKKGVVVKGVDV